MRITSVTMPDLRGKTVQQSLELLLECCQTTMRQVMAMNNEIEDLKAKVENLERRA